VWWDRKGSEVEADEAATGEPEVSHQAIWSGPSPDLESDRAPEPEATIPDDAEPWTVPEEWTLAGPDQVWGQPEPADEPVDDIPDEAELEPEAYAEPEPAEDRDSEEGEDDESSRYEIGQWDADPLELIFDESQQPESDPSPYEAAEPASDPTDLPDRWVLSTSRFGGSSRRAPAGGKRRRKRAPVAAQVVAPSPEPPAEAVLSASSPEPVTEQGPARRRRGRHLATRRSRRRISGFEEQAVGESGAAAAPVPIVIASRRRSTLASAVRILGLGIPLAAAALVYLSYVR
jgi:hypothetical protein